jgi:hypothetical protein
MRGDMTRESRASGRNAIGTLDRRACLACTAVALNASWLNACAADRPPVSARTQHMTVYGPTPSGAQLDAAEQYIVGTAQRLGVDPPAQIHYIWTDGISGLHTPCQGGGFADPGESRIESSMFPHYHELGHIVSAPLGRAPLMFVEGLAEHLSPVPDFRCTIDDVEGPFIVRPEWLPSRSFAAALRGSGPEDPRRLYVVVGVFTRLVIARYGLAAYLRFYRSLTFFSEPLEVRRAFLAATGATLDEAIARTRDANTQTL